MSFNYNHTILVGRLTKDPVMTMQGECHKAEFTLGVDRPYRKDDGTTETDFVPVVMWGKLAEFAGKRLRKGRTTLVEGRIQVRDYEHGEVRKWISEVIADNFQNLEPISNG